jgi:hypothetical protein
MTYIGVTYRLSLFIPKSGKKFHCAGFFCIQESTEALQGFFFYAVGLA